MKTVLIPPIINWDFLKQLPQQMAEQFAKNGYKVYFCNQHVKNNDIIKVSDNLIVYNNYNMLLDEIHTKKLKIDILYNTWAKNYKWVDYVKPKVTIYHSCDSFDEWKSYEKSMLDKSDIVLCTSEYIYNLRKVQHNNVHLVRNAANETLLSSNYEDITFLNNIKEFKFGFVGAIGTWVSTYLMRKVADKYPTFFVGLEFGKKCPDNVINLGAKPFDELINYYNSFDAFILPFNTKSEITQAACPIKLYEYMCFGKPIVSTSWSETEVFNQNEKTIFTSKSDDEFLENIDYVANLKQEQLEQIKTKYKSIASVNTWLDRFKQIDELIKKELRI
jgi:glycosyltransferase involved in cell wall biosynthesis